jgi:predicted metalloprotease
MRWRGNRRSDNIEDRRHTRASRSGSSGGAGVLRLIPVIYRFLGFKGTAVVAVGVLGFAALTGNMSSLLGVLGLQQDVTTTQTQNLQQNAEEKELVAFVSTILADTEDTWHPIFQEMGKQYKEPKLVLFRDVVKSACGMAQSATGPFYCPGDHKIYIDLGFYDQLKNRFNAPGDFAQAYVIAHEVGHHIQTLMGISSQVHQARKKLSKVEGNKLSVQLELQADCLAGVWANHTNRARQLLEAGDIEEGLAAASAIGDDNLQKQSKGYVTPDSFTHGSSKQRVKWFQIGLAEGDMDSCDTFDQSGRTAQKSNQSNFIKISKPSATADGSQKILAAYQGKQSDVLVEGFGRVIRILPDDNKGSRHQKFILKLSNGQSLLVAHNIDLAPRITALKVGDRVEFSGEYEWNKQGGVLHWTHHDPRNRHPDGWLKHNGRQYQ